jgi:tetratricopeptide (TPR) repeat protein
MSYDKQGKKEQAEQTIQEAIERFPDEVNGWYYLGLLLHSQKRTKEAEKAYWSAIKCQPD